MAEFTILCIVYHEAEGNNFLMSNLKNNMAVFKEIGCEGEWCMEVVSFSPSGVP